MTDQKKQSFKKSMQRSLRRIRIPFKITRWTIFFAVLTLIICVGALVTWYMSNKPVPKTSTNISSNSDGSLFCFSGKPNCPLPSNTPTPTQSTTPEPESTQASTQNNKSTNQRTSSESGSTLDQYGCVVDKTPSYYQCVKTGHALWCNSQISEPALAFSGATVQARAAYNSVMNEWETAQYVTPHNPKSEYLADATSKFNAIYEPAYNTYFAQVQSLNSQGCSSQYPSHELAGQYW